MKWLGIIDFTSIDTNAFVGRIVLLQIDASDGANFHDTK